MDVSPSDKALGRLLSVEDISSTGNLSLCYTKFKSRIVLSLLFVIGVSQPLLPPLGFSAENHALTSVLPRCLGTQTNLSVSVRTSTAHALFLGICKDVTCLGFLFWGQRARELVSYRDVFASWLWRIGR